MADASDAPPKVTPYDGTAVRRTLDDCVAEVMRSRFGYAEDMFWPNLKLGLMLAACLVAAFAQFNPYPFPSNRLLLGTCVIIYFLLSGILQLLVSYVEKDLIFASIAESGELVRVRTSMKKYEDHYTATLERVEAATGRVISRQSRAFNVGTMIDVNGYICLDSVEYNLGPLEAALKSKRA